MAKLAVTEIQLTLRHRFHQFPVELMKYPVYSTVSRSDGRIDRREIGDFVGFEKSDFFLSL